MKVQLGSNTGKKIVKTIGAYYAKSGLPVLDCNGNHITKPNKIGDVDYIPPMIDYCNCPDGVNNCLQTSIIVVNDTTTTTQTTTNCNLSTINWLSPIIVCNNNNTSTITLVTTATNQMIEFLINGVWQQANIGNNKIQFTLPSGGQLISTHFRTKGCTDAGKEGFFTTCV